jgi:hypothetical protein
VWTNWPSTAGSRGSLENTGACSWGCGRVGLWDVACVGMEGWGRGVSGRVFHRAALSTHSTKLPCHHASRIPLALLLIHLQPGTNKSSSRLRLTCVMRRPSAPQNPEVSKSVKGHGTPSWRTMEKMLAYCGTVVVRGGGGGTTEAGGSGAQALAVPCDECGAGRVLRWHLSLPGG